MCPCDAAESHKKYNQQSEAQHRAAQVVENFPASDGVHLVLHFFTLFVAHAVFQPAYYLPVAARPAVVPLGVVDVVGRVVVEKLQVVDEAAADVAALDKVVAQYEVFRESALQHLLENLQVINSLAAEGSLVEDVLIQFKAGCGIDVQPA